MMWIFLWSCSETIKPNIVDTGSEDTAQQDSGETTEDTGSDTGEITIAGTRFVALEEREEGLQLVVGDINNWSEREIIRETAEDALLRSKHGSRSWGDKVKIWVKSDGWNPTRSEAT